jgi:alkylation response protein AidB-like acyl-CoA dehydrogenase
VDFELSEDQEALQEGIRSFCEGRFSIEAVRGLIDHGGVERAAWRELGEMGVFSLRLPEADGGAGLATADAVLAFEELVRAIVPGPLVWSHLAAGLFDGAADGSQVVSGVERHDHGGLIEYLPDLDVLLVLDDDGIFHVDPTGLDAEPVTYTLDPLAPVHLVAELPRGDRIAGDEDVARWRRDGAALTAGYLLGVAQAATASAVAYAMEREQFNRPVGSFQAVKHLCADMVVRNEVARAASYAAGVTIDDPEVGSIERAVVSAKLMANDAAIDNAKTCVQVHGGMGYTWEVDAHLFFKRAYALESQFGSRETCADRMAELVAT